MKDLKNVQDFVKGINKGTFGICMVTLTEPKMKKGLGYNRSTKTYNEENRLFGKVKKLTYTANVALGYDYVGYLRAKAEKQGIVDFKFETEKPKGKSWFAHPYLLVSDTDEMKHYLRCYYRPNTKSIPLYYVNGNLATENEVEYIKRFMDEPKPSKKQVESGLDAKNEVLVRDYSFDSVIALWQGDKVYNRLNTFVTLEEIRKIFK